MKHKVLAGIKSHKERKTYYLGYIIIKCQSVFQTPYYTIINPKTGAHVHASTFKLACKICQEADFFKRYGFFRAKQIHITNRASKLAFRYIKGSDKHEAVQV